MERLRRLYPAMGFTFQAIKTSGDDPGAQPYGGKGVKGLFVKEIEAALLRGDIDLAVHSAKDLAAEIPAGLTLGPAIERDEPWDVFIGPEGSGLADLPEGSTIGTSSLRRQAFVRAFRPGLDIRPLRGNVGTRLKAVGSVFTGIILAKAAITRLGLSLPFRVETLTPDVMPPSPGQGQLALELRDGDEALGELLRPLDHLGSALAMVAERAFVGELGLGCTEPIAAHCEIGNGPQLDMAAALVHAGRVVRERASVSVESLARDPGGGIKFREPGEFARAEGLGRGVAAALRAKAPGLFPAVSREAFGREPLG
jgi:hydroxymethylbilane synthase